MGEEEAHFFWNLEEMGIVKMKNLVCLALLVAAGCSAAQAKVPAGKTAAAHAHAFALLNRTAVVNPAPAPELRCGGDKIITHGDGHTTPCPGCSDCTKQNVSLTSETLDIRPAVLTKVTRILDGSCADGSCTLPSVAVTADSCASGSCGAAASGGPIRNAIKARPLRGLVGKIRERKPVRSLLGRLFRRR